MKKLLFILLLALLPGLVQAQASKNSLIVLFESQPGVRPWKLENVIITSLSDMNGDGSMDLLLQRDDEQGHLKDLRVLDGRTRAILWDVQDVSQTFGVASDGLGTLYGFVDPDGDGEREAIFASEQGLLLINPSDNTLSFSWGETNDSTHELVGVADLTGDGFEEIILYLPDTRQVQVWSKP